MPSLSSPFIAQGGISESRVRAKRAKKEATRTTTQRVKLRVTETHNLAAAILFLSLRFGDAPWNADLRVIRLVSHTLN